MSPPHRPYDLLRRAHEQSADVISAVSPAQLTGPTPCRQFDIRTLVGHMVFAAERVGNAGRRRPISAEGEPFVTGIDDGEWTRAFRAATDDALGAWAAPGALEGDVALPFGTFPAQVVAAIYSLEQVTHAWDLAAAAGSPKLLDPGLAEAVLPVAHELLPAEGRSGPEMPFGPVVEVPAGAPAYDRLAGWMGRQPAFGPAGAPAAGAGR